MRSIEGWFPQDDHAVFDTLLADQAGRGQSGHLLEMGAFHGRSAVVIGAHRQEHERFVVADLFGLAAPDAANDDEVDGVYDGLTRDSFEANYRRFHQELPEIVHGPTTDLWDVDLPAASFRFVHVDASHLFEHVVEDIRIARHLVQPEGVVVFDDYRVFGTAGVAAAVWGAVERGELHVAALTHQKLYASPTAQGADLAAAAVRAAHPRSRELGIHGRGVVEVNSTRPMHPLARLLPEGARPAAARIYRALVPGR